MTKPRAGETGGQMTPRYEFYIFWRSANGAGNDTFISTMEYRPSIVAREYERLHPGLSVEECRFSREVVPL
jgi:hypothetical protein